MAFYLRNVDGNSKVFIIFITFFCGGLQYLQSKIALKCGVSKGGNFMVSVQSCEMLGKNNFVILWKKRTNIQTPCFKPNFGHAGPTFFGPTWHFAMNHAFSVPSNGPPPPKKINHLFFSHVRQQKRLKNLSVP